ncbi:MAG: long-chain fatty acid--CoA ligase [Thermoanaerobacteraceae bacterium]|nr:long-chain fatty acid--CoA ligase [Thermoanaerobacteraceae bacterium]
MRIFELHRRHRGREQEAALIYQGRVITYGELDRRVNSYTGYLQSLGLAPGERVALCAPNSPQFVYSYLGASQAGAVVVSLNLMLTLEEIGYILRDSGAGTLILHPAVLERLQGREVPSPQDLGINRLIVLNEETCRAIAASPDPAAVPVRSSEVCTYLYTSGTTGRPKGAMLTHDNLVANVLALEEVSHFGPEHNFLCVLPMFHSFSWTVNVLLPLYLGARVTVKESFQPKDIFRTLVEEDITIFCGVPAMFTVLWRMGDKGRFKALRYGISGGAPLPPEVQRGFEEKFSCPLVEGYGLSEASPVVALNPLYGLRKPGSIGLPLPGVEVKVVDDNDNEVPRGEVGELVVRGANVMQGYHNLPEETAGTLRGGWLHTGDLARQDEDGYLYVVDRKKDVIILSGFNVYPREIEDVLLTHPAVQDAAVIGVGDPLKGETIKAFIVLREGAEVRPHQLQEFLKERLAVYKIPRQWEFVEELPKNATGKVLKKLLRAKETGREGLSR